MPRNGSGTYTLPAGNPVTTGTLIEASWANTTLSDMASEMTDSLSRSGEGGMLAPLRLADGNLSTPGLAFSNEVATGFYRSGSASMWASVAGIQITQFTSTGMVGRFAAGAVGTPSITAHGDLNTGIYFPAADELAIATGGVQRIAVTATGVGFGVTPTAKFDIGGTGASTVHAVLTRGVDDSNFQLHVVSGAAGSSAGTLQSTLGLVYVGNGEAATFKFYRGGSATDGSIGINTNGTERFRILSNGALSVGSTGTGYGTSGQVLTSNGNAAPSWTTISSLTGYTGATNTALGVNAGDSLTSGAQNTFVGAEAGTAVTTGANSVFVGYEAGLSTTTGNFITAVGYGAARSNVAGSSTTAIGYLACYNPTGSFNAALGRGAMQGGGGSTISESTAVGAYALNVVSSGTSNTAVGYQAGYDQTSANWCTLIGAYAGANITSGGANTLVGYNTGQGITTGTTNCALGDSAYLSGNYSNSTCIGYDSAVTGSSQVQLGNSSTTTYAYGAVQDRSDLRDKTDIRDTQLGLTFIMALRPRDFKWDMREDYRTKPPATPDRTAYETDEEYRVAFDQWKVDLAAWEEANKLANITHNGTHTRTRYHQGLIAQEVKQTMDALGVDFGGYQDHSIKGGDAVLTIGYEEMIAPLIKAIQELKAEVDALKAAQGN